MQEQSRATALINVAFLRLRSRCGGHGGRNDRVDVLEARGPCACFTVACRFSAPRCGDHSGVCTAPILEESTRTSAFIDVAEQEKMKSRRGCEVLGISFVLGNPFSET